MTQQFLYAEGPSNAKIAIIGQAPGAEEIRQQRPNIGQSGKLLKQLMMEAGIDWRECYLTNIAKEQPPGNKFELIQHKIIEYLPIILNEIRSLTNLNVIVVCGKWPLKILCGLDSIDKWRGSIIESSYFPGKKVIPTLNPADILQYEYHMGRVMVVDFQKVKEESAFSEYHPPIYTFIYPKTSDDIIAFLDEHEGKEIAAVDTETYHPLRTSCISIAPTKSLVLSIPIEHSGKPVWLPHHEIAIIRRLNRYLKNTQFIMQNALFDLFVFRWLGYSIPAENLWMDTMLAHSCLYLEFPHGLDFLCSIYTQQNYYKDEGKSWHPSFNYTQLLDYNCKDSAVTKNIADQLYEELQEFGMWEFYQQQYNAVIPKLLEASLRGIPVNLNTQRELHQVYKMTETLLKREITDIVGEPLNVRSPKQMQKFLYESLGFEKVMKKGIQGKIGEKVIRPSTDESALKSLMMKYQDPRLQKFINLRKVQKVLSTYIHPLLDNDNRIRCSFNLMGTSTGRISEGPSATGSGMTLHNLPRRGNTLDVRDYSLELPAVKRMFVAEKSHILLIPDYKSAESFIVAMLAEEDTMLDILLEGGDIHKYVASNFIYKKPPEEISYQERYLSKRTGHAANYSMSWKKFMEILSLEDIFLPADETKRMLESYHSGFPRIRAVFHKKIERWLMEKRCLENPFGRKRFFFGRLDDELFRKGYAQLPQSTVADLLNRALNRVGERLPILGQQHDSMWVLSPIQSIEENIHWIWEQMKIPISIGKYTVEIPSDMKYGFDLDRMQEYKSEVDWEWVEKEKIRHYSEMGWNI